MMTLIRNMEQNPTCHGNTELVAEAIPHSLTFGRDMLRDLTLTGQSRRGSRSARKRSGRVLNCEDLSGRRPSSEMDMGDPHAL